MGEGKLRVERHGAFELRDRLERLARGMELHAGRERFQGFE